MIVVSNTTPLIGLATIRRFDFLRQLFGEVYIPQAVYNEAVVAGRETGGAKREASTTWIHTVEVEDRLAVEVLLDELDLGEAETIVLARELDADWVLMDEKKGRRTGGRFAPLHSAARPPNGTAAVPIRMFGCSLRSRPPNMRMEPTSPTVWLRCAAPAVGLAAHPPPR